MAGHAEKLDRIAVAAVDRSDHTHRQAFGLEHGALLDVQLGVGQDFAGPARRGRNRIRIEPELGERFAHRLACGVGAIEIRPIEASGDRAAAEQGRIEAHAFLVGEADDLHRERQARFARGEARHAFDGGDHAQHPIVLAGVAHRVQM